MTPPVQRLTSHTPSLEAKAPLPSTVGIGSADLELNVARGGLPSAYTHSFGLQQPPPSPQPQADSPSAYACSAGQQPPPPPPPQVQGDPSGMVSGMGGTQYSSSPTAAPPYGTAGGVGAFGLQPAAKLAQGAYSEGGRHGENAGGDGYGAASGQPWVQNQLNCGHASGETGVATATGASYSQGGEVSMPPPLQAPPSPFPSPMPPPVQANSTNVWPGTDGAAVGVVGATADAQQYPLLAQHGGGGGNHVQQRHHVTRYPSESIPHAAAEPSGTSHGFSGNTPAVSTPRWADAAPGRGAGTVAGTVPGGVQRATTAADGGPSLADWAGPSPPLSVGANDAAGATVAGVDPIPTTSAVKGWVGVPIPPEGGISELERAMEASRLDGVPKDSPSTASEEERMLAAVLEASRLAEVERQQEEMDAKAAMDVSDLSFVVQVGVPA